MKNASFSSRKLGQFRRQRRCWKTINNKVGEPTLTWMLRNTFSDNPTGNNGSLFFLSNRYRRRFTNEAVSKSAMHRYRGNYLLHPQKVFFSTTNRSQASLNIVAKSDKHGGFLPTHYQTPNCAPLNSRAALPETK